MARNFTSTSNYLATSGAGLGSASRPSGLNTNTGSISIWFNPTWSSGDSVWHQICEFFQNAAPTNNRFEILHFSDNNFYVGVIGNAADHRAVFADTGLITAATWYNILFTYTIGGTLTAYLNGVSKGTSSPTALNQPVDTLFVGVSDGVANPANASIADLAVWNVVLTQAEVTALSKGARPYTVRPGSLILWIPIDGLQSPEPDLSGNANNLPLVGSPSKASGPPVMMFTPRWPQFIPAAAVASGIKFRKTLSQIGGRVGTRQIQGWAN